jgi:thiol-disulfide isomerase/thioredoxin
MADQSAASQGRSFPSLIAASLSQAVHIPPTPHELHDHPAWTTTRYQLQFHISHKRTTTVTMPGKIIPVTSSSHFSQLLSQSTYTVVDFYADWCGPCKAIAPVFQNLAEKETKAGKLQFVKVDVDSQQEVAKKYGVSA